LKKIDPIDFHSMQKKYYRSKWGPSTVLLLTFFKTSSFMFSRRKKLIQVWKNLRVRIKFFR